MASPMSGRAGRLAGMWAIEQAGLNQQKISDLLATGQNDALNAIGQGRGQGLAALGQGYDAARPEYQAAIDRFNPWAEAGRGALTTYQNSLGQNGAAGNAAAVAQFQASPGYQYQVDEATDAVARKASALGALGSGNTMQAITDRASNLANQEYGGWQDRLNGLSNTGLAATGQQAGLQAQLGNLNAQEGRDVANLWGTSAGQEASTYGNFAGLGANSLANTGNQVISAGTGAMLAGQNAAQNRLNFGMGLAGLGVGLLGRGMGGGFGNMFGGGGGLTPGSGGLY